MPRFDSRALYRLPQLLGYGGNAPRALDNDAPIQPVLNVSRMAELGAIQTNPLLAGYFHIGTDQVHAGAGSLTSDISPYAGANFLDPTWGVDNERWLWITDAAVSANASVFTAASLSLGTIAMGNALLLRDQLLCTWDAVVVMHDPEATGFTQGAHPATRYANWPARPRLVPPGAAIGFRSTATGVGTVRFLLTCYICPIGTFPPGLS